VDIERLELVEQHVGLVEQIVHQLAGTLPDHVDRSELLAAGRLGLVEAAERFDFDQPVPFASFASTRIRGAALDAIRESDWTPRRTRALARQVELTRQDLRTINGSEPTDDQIAETLELPAGALRRLRNQIDRGHVDRLDALGGERPAEEVLDDPTAVDIESWLVERERRSDLRQAIASLDERLRVVVTALYLEGRTNDDVATLLGVSRSRVSQLRAAALGALRHLLEATDPGERNPGSVPASTPA